MIKAILFPPNFYLFALSVYNLRLLLLPLLLYLDLSLLCSQLSVLTVNFQDHCNRGATSSSSRGDALCLHTAGSLLCEQSQDPSRLSTLPGFPPGAGIELLEFIELLLTKGYTVNCSQPLQPYRLAALCIQLAVSHFLCGSEIYSTALT